MHTISPGGFALALALLVVVWILLPDATRLPVAFLLIAGALAWTGDPAGTVQSLADKLRS